MSKYIMLVCLMCLLVGCAGIRPFEGYVEPTDWGWKFRCPDNGTLTYKEDENFAVELTVDCKRAPLFVIGDMPDVKLD